MLGVQQVSLSVLDQSPVRSGGTAQEAVQESLLLAQAADRLGYTRYWVAEHHNMTGLASTAPEVLIGHIAANTKGIRVGSGGVMLSHYSPLKVAESFNLLATLYPGRIDLGVGRAPGSDARTARALAPSGNPSNLQNFPEHLMNLYGFLSGDFPKEHRFHGIRAQPLGETIPDLWILGSSDVGAEYAAELGWNFCHAYFINPHSARSSFDAYRKLFSPSPVSNTPRTSIGVSVLCAETHEEAERLSWSRWGWRLMGRVSSGGIPTVEEAHAFDYSDAELEALEEMKGRSIYGDPAEVKAQLLEIGEEYGTNEFVIVTITHDFESRLRSYELLAEAFSLKAR